MDIKRKGRGANKATTDSSIQPTCIGPRSRCLAMCLALSLQGWKAQFLPSMNSQSTWGQNSNTVWLCHKRNIPLVLWKHRRGVSQPAMKGVRKASRKMWCDVWAKCFRKTKSIKQSNKQTKKHHLLLIIWIGLYFWAGENKYHWRRGCLLWAMWGFLLAMLS